MNKCSWSVLKLDILSVISPNQIWQGVSLTVRVYGLVAAIGKSPTITINGVKSARVWATTYVYRYVDTVVGLGFCRKGGSNMRVAAQVARYNMAC